MLMVLCILLLVLIVKVCPHGQGEEGGQPKRNTCGKRRGEKLKCAPKCAEFFCIESLTKMPQWKLKVKL